jgi:hypothetical protein
MIDDHRRMKDESRYSISLGNERTRDRKCQAEKFSA